MIREVSLKIMRKNVFLKKEKRKYV
jgi:hypothetical protein